MINATHEQVRKTLLMYRRFKVPYTFEVQNETISVKSPAGSYSTINKSYSIEEINFIKKVKQCIVKNGIHHNFEKPDSKVMYFKYGKCLKPGEVIKDCINIDLTGAYWQTAYMLDMIPPDIYKEGLNIKKQVRLAAIGSLAKKKRVYTFDGVKLVDKTISRSETEHLWDVICHHVGSLLMKVAKECGSDFIFFWVDGIYVRKKSAARVEKMFKSAGYEFKTAGIKKISVTTRNMFVDVNENTRKPFVFRSKLVSKDFLGYNSDL